ncbi:MAG: discoidin domain-containing protein, partial [Planctomycetota bacterium]
ERLRIPYHLVAGNHDIGNKLTLDRLGERKPAWADDRNVASYRESFGEPFYSFERKGSLFVVLCDALMNSGQAIEREQWQWLEGLLRSRAKKARNIFMATHNVLYWNDRDDIGGANYEVIDEPARSRLLALCDRYKVRGFLMGHCHWEILNRHNGTWLFAAHSASFTRNGSWSIYAGVPSSVDTAKAGYYFMRVKGTSVTRNLIRTVDLLPDVRPHQDANPNPPKRLVAMQTRDRVPARLAVTIRPVWQRLADGHPGLAIDGNTRRTRGMPGKGDVFLAWASDPHDAGQSQWLEVKLAKTETLSRVVLYPGRGGLSRPYRILTSTDGRRWRKAAEGRKRPGTRPRSHRLGGVRTRYVRYFVPEVDRGVVALRQIEVYNRARRNVAHRDLWATASASTRRTRKESAKNTLSLSNAFDLNPSIVRLAPEAAAWETVVPLPGIVGIDRWAVETARHAATEGAKVCVTLTTKNRRVPAGERKAAFRAYASFVAKELSRASIWHVDGPADYLRIAMREVRKLDPRAKFASRDAAAPADFLVRDFAEGTHAAKRPTLVLVPPFRAARETGPAKELARRLVTLLDDENVIPCLSLLPEEGLVDELDNPMYAFYAARTLATVLAGTLAATGELCAPAPGVEMRSLTGERGERIVLWSDEPKRVSIELERARRAATLVDPLTATTTALVLEGRTIFDLKLEDYPLVISLATGPRRRR